MRSDSAHSPADRERDLDHLVERRPVAGRAQCAVVFLLVDALQCRAGIEHATAAGAQHVPRQLEHSEARGMQKGCNGALLIDPGSAREIDHIDAAEVAIGRVPHQLLDRPSGFEVGRLPQEREQIAGFAHLGFLHQFGWIVRESRRPPSPRRRRAARADAGPARARWFRAICKIRDV